MMDTFFTASNKDFIEHLCDTFAGVQPVEFKNDQRLEAISGGVRPNPRKFRHPKSSPAMIVSWSMVCLRQHETNTMWRLDENGKPGQGNWRNTETS